MSRTNRNAPSAGFVPRFDTLESRWCPSASTVSIVNHVLVVDAVNSGDVVAITDDGNGNVSATITGADSASTHGAHVTGIRVISENGGDTFNYTLTGLMHGGKNMNIDLKKGGNHVNLNLDDGVTGGTVNIRVTSLGGADSIAAGFGALTNTTMNFIGNFAKGGDSVAVGLVGNITGNTTAAIAMHALQGNDTFAVNTEDIKVGGAATLGVNLTGNQGNDQFQTNFQGLIDGHVVLLSHGHNGDNSITTNVIVDKGSVGNLITKVTGFKGNNNLTLDVVNNALQGQNTTLASDTNIIGGINGTETLNFTSNVHVINS